MEDIILAGFGGHAKSVADAIEQAGKFRIVGYIDISSSDCNRYQWLGTDDCAEEYYKSGIRYAAISVGYLGHGYVRDNLYEKLKKAGYQFPIIADPSAMIAKNAQIGEGTFIGKGAIINAGAQIGKMCIINSGALIEHENIIGDFSHIAVRAALCGDVKIGDHAFIGANATVVQGIRIHSNSFIKAGSIVIRDIVKV